MKPTSRTVSRALGTALALSLLTACLALPAASSAAPSGQPHTSDRLIHAKRHGHHRKAVKPRPTYWGAWIGDQITGEQPPWDMGPVDIFAGLVDKGLSLVAFGSPFANCDATPCSFYDFPTEAMDRVRAYGAIPFFNWSSQAAAANPSLTTMMPDFQLADILSGRYDAYIWQFATDARAWGHPFFLRFNWEMNGDWFPWAESVNGNGPGESVAVWRHVHDIFAAAGAVNATWVWCPYVDPRGSFQPLAEVYPGDTYVDWTCLDGFNWTKNPTNPHPWRSFDRIFSATYHRVVKRIAPTKPMVLAETASGGRHRAKARWIDNMFKMLRTKYRRIRGLIWFDQVDRGIEWPLETSPLATRAFAKGVRPRAYRPNAFAAATSSPISPPR